MPSNALYRTPDSVMNALSGPQGPLGMDPNVNRLSLLPRYNQREGLVAPQWLYDLARAAEAPGNALMGHQTTPEEAFNFAGNVAGAGLGSSAMMKAPAPGPGKTVAQTVYHGSPHNFDQFDLKKIGTGEGAQAYGHGLYVAENPRVAKSYTTAGIDPAQMDAAPSWVNAKGQSIRSGALHEALQKWANPAEGSVQPAIDRIRDFLKSHSVWADYPEHSYRLDDARAQLNLLEKSAASVKPKKLGNLYTVDLPDSAIANMLDWDAPLSQQPAVSKALDELIPKLDKDAAALLKADRKKLTGWGAHTYAVKALGSDRAASEFFKSKGIPGIRYLDGGSRDAGEGTRNFVVFDDKLLKILNKE